MEATSRVQHIDEPDPRYYLSDNFLTIDYETTNLDKGTALNKNNRVVATVWKIHGTTSVAHYGNPINAVSLFSALDNVDFVVAHNAKFEIQWLNRLGYPAHELLWYDTMLGEYVLAGNRHVDLSLGDVSKKRGLGTKDPFIDICMKGGVCPSIMPKELLLRRCKKDVDQTEAIFLQQRQELVDSDRLKTVYTRCILTPVLADMETRGLHLDKELVNATYRAYQERLEASRTELDRLTGGINLRSRPQLAEFLYDKLGFSEPKDRRGNPDRTGKGGRKTDAATIASFIPRTEDQLSFVQAYNEFQATSSALSKNLDFFKGVVTESETSTFFGQFNQAITQTHRLSSSGRPVKFEMFNKPKSVQFQNLPRSFKKLFSAREEGWYVGEIDGAQLEFRVAAHLGRDDTACAAIREGFDVHSFTASVLTEHGEPTSRQDAKAHTFKPLYGGRSGTRAQRAYYEAFRTRYGGVARTQEDWIARVLASKKLTIPSGLVFYWPDTKLDGDYITNTPSICNYPVQSYATADIIPIGVTKLWYDMKAHEMQSYLINTIHDSAIGEIHPDEVELYKDLAVSAFTDYVYRYLHLVYEDDFSVPLGAEVKIGTHWSTGDEFKYSTEPPVWREVA